MTKKLINRIFSLILIIAIIYTIIYTANHLYSCNIRDCIFCNITTVIGICIVVSILIILLNLYSDGDFDDFFEKHTDPKLKKICDFINRRNGGCNEKD